MKEQHCKNCNCEPEEWKKIPELKIELSSVTKIKSGKEIIIPKGCRLPTYAEYALAIERGIIPHTEEWVEYCTSPLWKGTRAVWLNILADWSDLNCDGNPFDNLGRSRGYRLVRSLK